MSKSFEVKTLDAIPLPKTVRDALISIPEGHGYASRTAHYLGKKTIKKTRKGGETGEEEVTSPVKVELKSDENFLTSDNHAFYIGKFFPKSRKQRVAELLGWSTRDVTKTTGNQTEDTDDSFQNHIYSEELIESSLSYLLEHLQPDSQAVVVVGQCLSEMINGPEDIAGALSADEEIELIKKIAKKKIPARHEQLQILKLDQTPLHQDLFSSLKAHLEPETGKCNVVEALFGNVPVWEKGIPSSLQIAAILLQAAEESDDLAKRLRQTVPGRLRSTQDDEQVKSAQNYGMTEIAIRLAEILNGRNIHLGAERQAVYDDTIVELLKGQYGRFAKVKALRQLMELLESKSYFETVHIDNKVNPSALGKIRSHARSRLAIVGLTLTGTLATVYGIGEHKGRLHQQDIQSAVDGSIQEKLEDTTFYWDYKWPMDKKFNVLMFHRITDGVLIQMLDRYNLPPETMNEARPLVESFLLEPGRFNCHLNEEVPLRIRMADQFVEKNRMFFMSKGLNPTRPYVHMDAYLPLMDHSLTENFEQFEYADEVRGNLMFKQNNADLEILGRFRTGGGYNSRTVYYFAKYFTKDGKHHLLAAREDFEDEKNLTEDPKRTNARFSAERPLKFTSKLAREMTCNYIGEMKLYDANKFEEHNSFFEHLVGDNLSGAMERGEVSPDFVVASEDAWKLRKIGTYKDYAGAFEYELAKYVTHEDSADGSTRWKEILVAKEPSQDLYSTATAILAANHYHEAMKWRWDRWQICHDW
jgi:hypothetical protein